MVGCIGQRILSFSHLSATKCLRMRNMSVSCALNAKSLLYKEYGDPEKVLQISTVDINPPQDSQVTVKWLYSPVNPADINTIQGVYPSKPPLPAVPGNEGVGKIAAIGSNIQGLGVGDVVVPSGLNLGTWRSHSNHKPEELLKIPDDVDIIAASMLKVNPCTAYRMLKDFVPLKPGDTVIQNGGNSAVGQLVIQLCREWNYRSVNVVRNRSNIQELKDQLKNLGADEVLTEEEIRTTEIFKSKKLPRPKLAFNCVGGQNAVDVMRHLAHGGVMVTYGAMSREPLTIPASALIFKDVTFKGFWLSAWSNANMQSQERITMINDMADMFKKKKLEIPPYKLVPLSNYREAISNALNPSGKTGLKYILDMSKE